MLIKKTPGGAYTEYYGTYAEFLALVTANVTDCSIFYIKDWKELSEDVKTTLVSRIQMWDTASNRWIPQ